MTLGGKVARPDVIDHFFGLLDLTYFTREVLIDRFAAPVCTEVEYKVDFEEVVGIRIRKLVKYFS